MTEQFRESPANDPFKCVGMLGLGIMGSAISRNLISAGRSVVGYDPDEARRTEALAIGVKLQDSAADVAAKSALILLSLPDCEALDESVVTITDRSKAQSSGHILAELSTLDLECKFSNRERLAEVGISFLDCPISGTGAQALTGDIAIYASGDIDAHNQCLSVFQDFARSVHYLGEFGQGTKMKFVANLLVAIHNVATAEALVFGKSCGLDADMLCDVIGAGAGSSRIFELRSSLMASVAAEIGVPTPLFSATSPLYSAAIKKGLGQQDTAAVCTVLQAMAEQQIGKT
jgi:3-hydroxyisobutyrate dehydrogenase-like beta-hydroxyacid dehydrogenase